MTTTTTPVGFTIQIPAELHQRAQHLIDEARALAPQAYRLAETARGLLAELAQLENAAIDQALAGLDPLTDADRVTVSDGLHAFASMLTGSAAIDTATSWAIDAFDLRA